MKRAMFNSAVLLLCSLFPFSNIFAQDSEEKRQILSLITIERFDWYSEREVIQPRVDRSYYRRGLPAGESANAPPEKPARQNSAIENFIYRLCVRNLSDKVITSIVWHYDFYEPLSKKLIATHEFESRARIKPNKRKTLYAESPSPPTQIIDVNLLLLNKKQPFLEMATIKTITFPENPKKNKK